MNRREALIHAALQTRPSLPLGYTELEYLYKTNKSSYVDTPLPAKTNYRISGKLTWYKNNQNTSYLHFFGVTSATDGELSYLFVKSAANVLCVRQNNTSSQDGYCLIVTENTPFTFDVDLRSGYSTFTMNESTCPALVPYVNKTIKNYSSTLYLKIGAYNSRGGASADYSYTGRIYWLKVEEEEGSIAAWYIPARRDSDGYLGFYDVANGTFLLPNTQTGWVAP